MEVFRFGLLLSAVFLVTINVIQVDAIECGTVNLYREAVLGGKEVLKDEWPFIAALYYSRSFKYFCGGTVISKKHVLTAAHCIQKKFESFQLSPDEIIVRLGAYNLTDRSEKDVVNRKVLQINLHPDWKVNEERYDADIAILALNESLTFSNHIRPVCMPPVDFLIDGLSGTVVGWGRTENGTAEGIPRKIEINALNDMHCYKADEGIGMFASERSFCGEGSGTPNVGDSGGGFFAIVGSGWTQFGTVSFARPEGTGNNLRVAMYMKLTSLRDWIADRVEQSGGNISVATTSADLNCTFGHTGRGYYSCSLYDLNIRQESFVVKNFTGSHHFDNDNEDVELIVFQTGVMASLPRNFGTVFRNLKYLTVYVDTRRIFRSNFQNLERLEGIRFWNSSIAGFDENSLWELSNLETFQLMNNKLKLLHATTFSRNYKLRIVEVLMNTLKSLPRNLFQNNSFLQLVAFDDNLIDTIDERIFESNAHLVSVSLGGNRLIHLSKNLFRNNSELQTVDLSNNRLKIIDEQSFEFNRKLQALSLHSNELEFLPAQLLRGMTALESFLLHDNAMRVIDEQFFETNVQIKAIMLHSNQLARLPAHLFRSNSQLTFIDLAANVIETMDEELFEQNSLLVQVNLELNFLVELPGNLFRHNSMLEHVELGFNLLEAIDERTFKWNTRLLQVHFQSNFVSFLPWKLFETNVLLETVAFPDNSLEAIDERTFQTNANLHTVDLSANTLSFIPENLFRDNPLLRILDFSGNFFMQLSENIFSGSPNLEQLLLQESTLQSLPRNLFRENSFLQHIDLKGNELNFIETDFTHLKHAAYIDLSENVCIDTVFHKGESLWYRSENEIKMTNNLTEFQSVVMDKCSKK